MDTVQASVAAASRQDWPTFLAACFLRWHLCSLDAPTVAVVWAIALGRLAGVRLPTEQVLVLGLGTWIVYILDRVLDGVAVSGSSASCGLPAASGLRERHYFHRRYRERLLTLGGLAAMVLMALCFRLPRGLVSFYLLLGLPVAVYALLVHQRLLWPTMAGRGRAAGRGSAAGTGVGANLGANLGKEAAVAILFTAAVAAPAVVASSRACRPALLVASLLLALLCWLNCSLISHAESTLIRHAEQAIPEGALRERRKERLELAGATLALACAAGVVTGRWVRGGSAGWCAAMPPAAVLLSCLVLLVLIMNVPDTIMNVPDAVLNVPYAINVSDTKNIPDTAAATRRLRVLVDLSLLTPLLFLLTRA